VGILPNKWWLQKTCRSSWLLPLRSIVPGVHLAEALDGHPQVGHELGLLLEGLVEGFRRVRSGVVEDLHHLAQFLGGLPGGFMLLPQQLSGAPGRFRELPHLFPYLPEGFRVLPTGFCLLTTYFSLLPLAFCTLVAWLIRVHGRLLYGDRDSYASNSATWSPARSILL
jgi:hypothetical protein